MSFNNEGDETPIGRGVVGGVMERLHFGHLICNLRPKLMNIDVELLESIASQIIAPLVEKAHETGNGS